MKEKRDLVERAVWENVKATPVNDVVFQKDWVQLTTPGAATPVMNGVFRCELETSEAEAKIVETIAAYRAKGLPFRWKTCSSSRPANLEELLTKHGMVLKDKLFGMIATAERLNITTNPEVEIRELSMELKADWLVVQASAWQVPPEGIRFIDSNFHREFDLIERGQAKAFLAYYGGAPVASAGLLLHKEYGYLVGGATAPAYRGKGIYKNLLKKRVEILSEMGSPAVVHCVWNTSAPICLKLGFEKVCEINSFELASWT